MHLRIAITVACGYIRRLFHFLALEPPAPCLRSHNAFPNPASCNMTKHTLLCSATCVLLLACFALAAGCSTTLESARPDNVPDNIVATYGGQSLTLSEFEEQYARTVGNRAMAQDDSLAEYQDFLQRYVDFRLKVLEGRQAGYHEDPSILAEINNYRTSFAKPYLLDKEVITPVIEDLYERSSEMVKASHILIRVPPTATPADTLAAYNKITAIRDSVQQGIPFGDLAFRNSEDPSAQREGGGPGYRGDLGFFTAGRMVEEFENQAYMTPVGEVSEPFRTQFGYHILYVDDRQPTVPNVEVSHIMSRIMGQTPEDTSAALTKIQEAQARLAAGEPFGEVASALSDDTNSARNGGAVGTLRYDDYRVAESFREAAFALEVGTPSDIVQTPYGYHIILLTDRDALGTFEEEYESLKKIASNLPRTKRAEEQLAIDTRKRYNATIDSTALRTLVVASKPDSVLIQLTEAPFTETELNQSIVTLGDSTFTVRDLSTFVKNNRIPRGLTPDEQLWNAVDALLDQAALDYEAAQLEQRDDEFGRIMQEFRDGLVLFRLMEDSVWTAAAQDSAAVQAYYEAHRNEYRFGDRTRVIEIYSPMDSILTDIDTRLDNGTALAAITASFDERALQYVTIDTLMVEGATNSIYDRGLSMSEGDRTDALEHRQGQVILIHAGVDPARPKTFEEARTETANDYQQVLEDRLMNRLRNKYDVRTFPQRLVGAFEEDRSMSATTTDAME